MHRFYSPHTLTTELRLSYGDQFHQIFHVFRSKKGSSVIFFEADGDDRVYEVVEVGKKEALFREKNVIKKIKKIPSQLTIFLAYSHKIATLEMIVQKLTELGISEIIFLSSEYAQLDLISENKQKRLTAISLEALEQSGGNRPIILNFESKSIENLLMEYSNLTMIVGSPHAPIELTIPRFTGPMGFWIGPEGGWSPDEMKLFEKYNSYNWCLSNYILRMETAAIVGAGILSYLPSIEH